jgi:hypothetical protein
VRTDQEVLILAEEYDRFSKSAVWAEIQQFLNELAGESQAALDNCLSGDAEVHKALNIRNQQRRSVMLALKEHVETWVAEKTRFMEEANGNADGDTGTESTIN